MSMIKRKPTKSKPIIDIAPPLKERRGEWQRYMTPKLITVAVLIIVILAGGLIFSKHHSSNSSGTATSGQKQIDDTVAKVGKHILLPSGEQPVMAIVNDPSNVSFFKNAAKGDRLLVYAQAREAILYRPSIDKIIAVAPINPDIKPQSTTTH